MCHFLMISKRLSPICFTKHMANLNNMMYVTCVDTLPQQSKLQDDNMMQQTPIH